MDEEEKWAHLLYQLNHALECGSSGEAQKAIDEINLRMRFQEMFPTHKSKDSHGSGSKFVNTISRVVRDKGWRLHDLERAFRCDKAVLSGSVDIKQNVLDALKGHEPLKVHIEGVSLKLTFTF